MKKIAVFAGSFDPFTFGHKNIVERALPLFDTVVIAVGVNAEKKTLISVEQRLAGIASVFVGVDNVQVFEYSGLTIDFCKKHNAQFIIRGIRNSTDFEYEKAIALTNKEISNGIESIFICADPQFATISSTIVRDLYRNGYDIAKYVPYQLPTHV